MASFSLIDTIAMVWFGVSFLGYSLIADHSPLRFRGLSAAMDTHRRAWLEIARRRDMRMVDTAILTSLQNGTAFFASTSLLAIGAAFTLLTATDELLVLYQDVPFATPMTRGEWEIKVLALLVVYAHAFFKFGWAYRLFNYGIVLLGAIPPAAEADTPEAEAATHRAADVNLEAAKHFNRGLRAFFFAIAILGWFINGAIFIVATTLIVVIVARRQFFSKALQAVRVGP